MDGHGRKNPDKLHFTYLTHPESERGKIRFPKHFMFRRQTIEKRREFVQLQANCLESQCVEKKRILKTHSTAECFMHVKSCLRKIYHAAQRITNNPQSIPFCCFGYSCSMALRPIGSVVHQRHGHVRIKLSVGNVLTLHVSTQHWHQKIPPIIPLAWQVSTMNHLVHTFHILQEQLHFGLVLIDCKSPNQGVKNLNISCPEINAAQQPVVIILLHIKQERKIQDIIYV